MARRTSIKWTFHEKVCRLVQAVPRGSVISYGEVARLAGHRQCARQVGNVLKSLPSNTPLPWHRVVNRHGKISLPAESGELQRQRLVAEGVQVDPDDKSVDLSLFHWSLKVAVLSVAPLDTLPKGLSQEETPNTPVPHDQITHANE
eukprot:Blabericola_migrator_1__157@NODE_1041_length_5625_cov_143_923893_g717_i0_p5_GENE_NODE_1041_length_5625_cov_143_923893_g717_i0NODE_1041_length_5625_cov_143_923893_g717_i0_p5_ORF_typecomplete_len146_score14_15DNA_binding_1/PF01035_20/1_7e24_NODE_1041_length_5625_cov_143_923893_g717_i042124649